MGSDMGKVTILDTTTKYPLTLMGERAGICWGSDITDQNKNMNRGKECLRSGHGRVAEFVNVEMVLDGYSARVIREWYTHIGGMPTRLQESTRYLDYKEFQYVVPVSVTQNEEAWTAYEQAMYDIRKAMIAMENNGVPKEDMAMLLPLGMETRIVDKRNLRNLIDMSHQRLCSRAYWEYRQLFMDVYRALGSISDEWSYIVTMYFKRKCVYLGYCPEKKSCGYYDTMRKGL